MPMDWYDDHDESIIAVLKMIRSTTMIGTTLA